MVQLKKANIIPKGLLLGSASTVLRKQVSAMTVINFLHLLPLPITYRC